MRSTTGVLIIALAAVVCGYTSAQSPGGGCNSLSTNGLIGGVDKTGVIPNIQATVGVLRPQVGGRSVTPWTLFSAVQVQEHGLWCQVNSASNAGMGSNIGDMFYSTGDGPDGFTVAFTNETNNNVPFQQLKCTNQIGLILESVSKTATFNYQGFLKCNTTIPNLDINTHYWVMYEESVFNEYAGPTVDSTMTLSILSPRDADPNISISLSFTVSFGPPSRIRCIHNSSLLLDIRNPDPRVTREVIRSRYISSDEPDMTRVTVRLDTQPRVGGLYACIVTVEGRVNIASGAYNFDQRAIPRTSTVTVTVAGTPTAVTVIRTTATNVRVSWTAPSSGPTLGGYEVFYQTATGSNGSSTTTTTELTLTGLVLEQTYSIFVVAFGPEGAPVLPSAHSNTEMITLTLEQPTGVMLIPTAFSIMVSWTAPQFVTPDSYTVSVFCLRLCDNSVSTTAMQMVSNGGAISHTITPIEPNSNCTVRVTAVVGSASSESDQVSTKSLVAAPIGYPEMLMINSTSVESRSLTVSWGKVPCTGQRGPITGYSLRYNSIVVFIAGEQSRQHMLTGLTPFTNYTVQVAGVNSRGIGSFGTALLVETLQDIPGPVTGLSATSGVIQLTISWSPPSEPNGRITMYQISYNTGVQFNISVTQYILRDLSPNTVVVFSVRAYTTIGPGENVLYQASTTSVPRVTGVRVVALNSTAVNVSWTPVTLLETEYCYTVHYTTACDLANVSFPANASSGVVSGLQEGQQHNFSVTVTFNVNGTIYMYTGQTSTVSISLVTSSCLPSTSLLVALVVIAVMFLASLIVNVIQTVLLLRKQSTSSKSPQELQTTNAVFETPNQANDVINMTDCAAYSTHRPLRQHFSSAVVYETVLTATT